MATEKQTKAREFISADIRDALNNIDDIRKLLDHANIEAEGELIGHLTEASAALRRAHVVLSKEA